MLTTPTHYPTGSVMQAIVAGVVDDLREAGIQHDVNVTASVTSIMAMHAGPPTFLVFEDGLDAASVRWFQNGNRDKPVPLASAGKEFLDTIRQNIARETKALIPASAQQALAIHYEETLVATARYQRQPNDAHKALLERRRRWLAAVGGVEALGQRARHVAESAAATRLADDDDQGRCLCGQCTTSPSASSERVPADTGREPPRVAAA